MSQQNEQDVEEQEVLKLAEECGAVMLVEMQDRYWRNTGGATFQSAQLQAFAAKLREKYAAAVAQKDKEIERLKIELGVKHE